MRMNRINEPPCQVKASPGEWHQENRPDPTMEIASQQGARLARKYMAPLPVGRSLSGLPRPAGLRGSLVSGRRIGALAMRRPRDKQTATRTGGAQRARTQLGAAYSSIARPQEHLFVLPSSPFVRRQRQRRRQQQICTSNARASANTLPSSQLLGAALARKPSESVTELERERQD